MTFFARIFSAATASLAILGAGLFAGQVSAQEKIGDFTSWSVYQYADEKGAKVCFMASQPSKSAGKYTRRDEVFFLITHRPSQNSKDVSSFVAGYQFKDSSKVSLSIDKKRSFSMFTAGDTAWALDEDDKVLLTSMIRGNSMVVKGTSSRGTLTTDTFSLSGFTKAYRAMSNTCGVKPSA